jgi:nucleoside 2-deoxyribosyltransferase
VVERDGEVRADRAPESSSQAFAVYVAAAATADQVERVASAIHTLRSLGFVVTCTWPEIVASTPGGANPRDASDTDRRGWTTRDLEEIDAADALWFLVPELPATTRGAWFEAGYAYSEHKHLAFSGDTKQSVFCALGIEFKTDAAAISHLCGLRDRKRINTGLTELRRNSQWPDEGNR